MSTPTLVTLYGEGNRRQISPRVWARLSPDIRKEILDRGEMLGVWPAVAAAAKVGLRVGAKLGKKVLAQIRRRRKSRHKSTGTRPTASAANSAALVPAESPPATASPAVPTKANLIPIVILGGIGLLFLSRGRK